MQPELSALIFVVGSLIIFCFLFAVVLIVFVERDLFVGFVRAFFLN